MLDDSTIAGKRCVDSRGAMVIIAFCGRDSWSWWIYDARFRRTSRFGVMAFRTRLQEDIDKNLEGGLPYLALCARIAAA